MRRVAIPKTVLRLSVEGKLRVECPYVGDARAAAAIAFQEIGDRATESLILLALDNRPRCTGIVLVASGGMHGVGVRQVDVLRAALMAHAAGFVLAHNHPSGDPTPSPEDVVFTARVKRAAAVIGIPMLDHVIVTSEPGVFASVPTTEED